MMRACKIGARGWEHEGWMGTFYPDDLPDDWRLGYYANEFPAVLVPADEWLRAPSAQLQTWRDDTPNEFRFYFEAPLPTVSMDACLLRLKLGLQVLDNRLGGLLYRSPPSENAFSQVRRLTGDGRIYFDSLTADALSHGHPSSGASVGCLPDEGAAELVQVREQIERVMEGSEGDLVLFFSGAPPNIKRMQQSILLTQLMGFA